MLLLTIGNSFYRWLVWGNVLMALSAAGWVVVTWNHLELPPDPLVALLAFALAIVFYTRDRLDPQEQDADSVTFYDRTEWVQRHRTLLTVWVLVALGVAFYCITVRPATWIPLLAGVGFALTYTVRWIPWRGQRWAWKQVPGLKTPYVALLWTILTVFAPAAEYDLWGTVRLWQVAGVIFLLILCQILLNDLRDIDGDSANNVYSLPVILGDYQARMLGMELLGLAAILGFVLWHPPFPMTALYTGILLIGYRRKLDPLWRPFIEVQGVVAGLLCLV